jgi:hypothetical protein
MRQYSGRQPIPVPGLPAGPHAARRSGIGNSVVFKRLWRIRRGLHCPLETCQRIPVIANCLRVMDDAGLQGPRAFPRQRRPC